MSNAAEVQALLRFLTHDAKTPLAIAIGKAKDLQSSGLSSAAAISRSDAVSLQKIFADEKLAKQILAAAKRMTKKRTADTSEPTGVAAASRKKSKPSTTGERLTPIEIEDSLILPTTCKDEDILVQMVLYTNRAPLVLAFAVTLLKFTMPDQPLSSRLSLAQAVVSMNSRSKAVSIGLESGKAAGEEGWGDGQPGMLVMGREVKVMKRWGYDWKAEEDVVKQEQYARYEQDAKHEQDTSEGQHANEGIANGAEERPALWGLDLEALKKSDAASATNNYTGTGSNLPIYTPQPARAYLLKSFDTSPVALSEQSLPKKQTNAAKVAEKEKNLGCLLGALELLFESWFGILEGKELDRRAWGWYVGVRPKVESGQAGWGGKGNVRLGDILDLRRKT